MTYDTVDDKGVVHDTNLTASGSTTFGVVVDRPDFTITADDTSLKMYVGESDNTTVTGMPINGFTGGISLSLDGAVPNGVSGSGPNISLIDTPHSLFTVSASPQAKAGHYSLTIAGISGSNGDMPPIKATTSINVEIKALLLDLHGPYDHTNHREGGPVGSDTPGVPVSNDNPDPHGPVKADTVVSWTGANWAAPSCQVTADPSDYSNYVWTPSGSATMVGGSNNGSPSFSGTFTCGTSKSGVTGNNTTIQCSAYTAKGSSVGNSYSITWHAPYENWTLNAAHPTTGSTHKELLPDDPSQPSVAGGTSPTWNFHVYNTYEGEAAAEGVAITAEVFSHYTPLEPVGSLLNAIGVYIDKTNEKTDILNQTKAFTRESWESLVQGNSSDVEWDASTSPVTPAADASDPNLWRHYQMKGVLWAFYKASRYNAANYAGSGYVADVPQSITKSDGYVLHGEVGYEKTP